jgi:putative oligomerization/nucleic acid binding protein
MYRQSKSAARTEFLERQGVLALAEVVGLTETYAGWRDDNDFPMTKLDLHISAPNLTPFNARKRVQASTQTQQSIITGRKLVVLVDPTDNSYQIDWQRSALIAGVAPVILKSTEDNRTYDLTGQVGPLMEYFQVLKAHRIPHGGKIDLRANPDVREQLLAVVRGAAAAKEAPAAPQSPPSASPRSMPAASAARMRDLETLRASGAITEAEYAAKRQQIISSL